MAIPNRRPLVERPDPEQRLLAAVAEGDTAMARRLAERLVHRRGLDGFRAWVQGPLRQGQGAAAVAWLTNVVDLVDQGDGAPSQQLRALPDLPIPQQLEQAAPAPASVRRLRSWLGDGQADAQANGLLFPRAS
ncbi:MAG: hypothetical protein K0U63_00255 [Cyanobacteria bacterium]|nr:hypothetical protein [Cyanobacteriota bacterium]